MSVIKTHLAALRASMTPKAGECGAGMCAGAASCRDRLCPGHPAQAEDRANVTSMERIERRDAAAPKFLLAVALAFVAAGLWVLWRA